MENEEKPIVNREVHVSSSSWFPPSNVSPDEAEDELKKQSEKVYRESMKQYVKFLENKIDQDLGFYFWKRYTAAAFWTQISTPINLLITLMTALTTAQSASSNILPEEAYKQVAIATLIITTLNTFFRPHVQLTYNTEQLQKWNDVGIEFEKVYYSNRDINTLTIEQIEAKVEDYKKIQSQLNNQRKVEGVGAINFITDIVHLIAMRTCIRQYKRWLDRDRRIQRKATLLEEEEKKKQSIQQSIADKNLVLINKQIEAEFKHHFDAIELKYKAQAEKIKSLEHLLLFAEGCSSAKSTKCLTNSSPSTPPLTSSNAATVEPPISPISVTIEDKKE